MAFGNTDIRWTDKRLNPIHGCSKTSEGCANCYAERVSRRFGHTDHPWTVEHADENVQLKPGKLDARLDESAWVFVNSMSDVFHQQVPDAFVHDLYDALGDMPRSVFQILTKHGPDGDRRAGHPPDNVMLGVSVESPRRRYRLDWLRDQPAATRFVSFEPLVECIPDVDLSGVDWAIIGGESGDNRREMQAAWARNLVRSCRRQDVPVFFKQHSGRQPEECVTLDMQDGNGPRRIEQWPELPRSDMLARPRKHMEKAIA